MLGKETRVDLKLLKNFFYIFVRLLLRNRPITSNIWVKLTKNTHDYYLIRHVFFCLLLKQMTWSDYLFGISFILHNK